MSKSILAVVGVVLCIALTASSRAQTKQEQVHGMSHTVMPFEMSKTRHIFAMTDTGGVQRVIVRDMADKDQIDRIREHLAHEAQAFARGDFADPAHLHGAAMPGLADMQAAADKVHVTFAPLPDGAQISFESDDRHAVTSIHRWFGAQLSEHGADAQIE